MISATQREALGVLAELLELSPDVRLGQLMAHLGFLGEDQSSRNLWDIDDEQLLAVLYHHRVELMNRTSPSAVTAALVSSNEVNAPTANPANK
ncbi:hypothetical protein NA78x_005754 [Anatilimnocola sp. NA78]|uniref:hypothetical protein n=1 Tax=Anatilimnocola sp. NA78 TaxID=3415683 RepID=UPI003CE4C6AD